MKPAANVIGERYGRAVVVAPGRRVEPGKRYVVCRCDCGALFEARLDNLRNGNTSGCCGRWSAERVAHVAIVVVVLGLCGVLARAAFAQQSASTPGLAARATSTPASSALLLSRVCWLEANWSHADCTAIGHVIRVRAKRNGSAFAEMAIAYSAIDSGTDRARLATQLPDGDEPTWGKGTNARWLKLRAHAANVMAGRVANPCAGASHWGARTLPGDVRRAVSAVQAGRWRVVECSAETANAFYAEVRR